MVTGFLPLVKWPDQSRLLASCGSSYQLRTGSERVNINCEYQTVFRITFWHLDLRSLRNYETTKLARKESRLVVRKPWAVRDPVSPPDLSTLWMNRRSRSSHEFRVSALIGLLGVLGGLGRGFAALGFFWLVCLMSYLPLALLALSLSLTNFYGT